MGPGCGPRCFPEGDFLWVVYSLRRGCPAISRAEKSSWSLDGAIELAIDTNTDFVLSVLRFVPVGGRLAALRRHHDLFHPWVYRAVCRRITGCR